MSRHPLPVLAVTICLLAGCIQPQQVVRLQSPLGTPDEAVDRTIRTLAQAGLDAAVVDRKAGVVHTSWADTGFLYGHLRGAKATIVRRYTATVAPGAAGSQVTLRADTKRCVPGQYTLVPVAPSEQMHLQIGGLQVGVQRGGGAGVVGLQGACEQMDGLVPDHQADLDALGAELQAALATP